MLRKEFLRGNKKIKKSRPAPRQRPRTAPAGRTTAAVIKARQCKKGAQKTDGRTALLKSILGGRSSASFLPLSFIAARRQSLFSSFFARHRATYHKCNCQSDSRCECELQRVESSDQPAGYSRLKADSFAQLCGSALLYYSLEFAPDVFL